MIRLLVMLVLAGLIAAGAVWLADHDGVIVVTMAGYEVRTAASLGLLMLAVALALLALVVWLALLVLGAPGRFGHWAARRRARKYYEALSHGLIAVATGDAREAELSAQRAEKLIGGQPLGLLLKAQAAELSGDGASYEAACRAMLDKPETEFLGLRGLFDQAMRLHDEVGALDYAARAYALKPKSWAMDALFNLRVSRQEWDEALALLNQAGQRQDKPSDEIRRRRGVLIAARSLDASRRGDATAISLALEALALEPGLTAPALIAARALASQGQVRQVEDIVEAAWKEAPHPGLAAIYATLHPEDDPESGAKRLTGLAGLNPDHRESRLLMAEQAIRCRRWEDARAALAPLMDMIPSVRLARLMVLIAEGEGNGAEAELWRLRASGFLPEEAWSCTRCESPAEDWAPLCANCGAFDSLSWSIGAPPLSGRAALASAASTPSASVPFSRPPDDPGPEAQIDIFGEQASEAAAPR